MHKFVPKEEIQPLLMPNGSIRPLKSIKLCSQKQINVGQVRSMNFNGNPLCDFKEWWCTYKNTHISKATPPRTPNSYKILMNTPPRTWYEINC